MGVNFHKIIYKRVYIDKRFQNMLSYRRGFNKEKVMNIKFENNSEGIQSKDNIEKIILDFIIEKNINDMDKICLLKELTDFIKAY